MINSIITYIITFLIGALLTYLSSIIPKVLNGEKNEKKALIMLLQNNLTNLAYVCMDLGYIMDYQLQNWCNMLESYEGLGADGYIHSLDKKIKQLPVKTTDILQNK